jgi:hypothetical protein
MNKRKPKKLTSEEIAAIKNSPLFAKKLKEAEVMFNSPAYIKHAKARQKKRLTAAGKNAKAAVVTGTRKIGIAKRAVSTKPTRRQVA